MLYKSFQSGLCKGSSTPQWKGKVEESLCQGMYLHWGTSHSCGGLETWAWGDEESSREPK